MNFITESELVSSTLTIEEEQEEVLPIFEFTKPIEINTDFLTFEYIEEVEPASLDVAIEEEVEEVLPFLEFIRP